MDVQKTVHSKEDELVLRCFETLKGAKPSLEFFSFFYDLLDRQAAKYLNEQRESDLDLFYVFFELLLPKSESLLRVVLLRKLNGLVFNTTYIKGYCSDRFWVKKCLKYLQKHHAENTGETNEQILTLVQILALFNSNPIELKILFNAVQSDWARPYWHLLIDLLHKMAMPREGPDVYFDFNGKDSGIILPMTMRQWPTKGYTFFCWLRIESFDDPTGAPGSSKYTRYQPRLISFLTEDKLGLEVYFVDNYLTIHTHTKKKDETKAWKFLFEPKKWYFVCITHEYHMLRKSEASLYVNGELIEAHQLVYPKLGETALNLCHFGNNFEAAEIHSSIFKGEDVSMKRTQPFMGQVGTFVLLEESLDAYDVQGIYQLGPNIHAKANADNTDYTFGQRGGVFILEKRNVKIEFAYSPKALNGVVCLDTATASPYTMATKMEGVKEWNTRGIHDTLYSMGGIKHIFALFTGLEAEQDPALIFALLSKIFSYSAALFEEEMTLSGGLTILGYLMESIPSECFSPETVAKLETLGISLLRTYGPQNQLFIDLLKHVFFNFSIWVQTTVPVQTKLIQVVSTLATEIPETLHIHIGVDSFLDIIKYFYFLLPIYNKRIQVDEKILQKRPNTQELLMLRTYLVKIAYTITGGTLRTEEVQAIVRFLHDSSPEEHWQVLEVFSRALCQYFEKVLDSPTTEDFIECWENHPLKQTPGCIAWPTLPVWLAYSRLEVMKKARSLFYALDPYDQDLDEESILWRLDRTENSNRMRRRLKQFYRASRHVGCAKGLDETPPLEDSFVMLGAPPIPEKQEDKQRLPRKAISFVDSLKEEQLDPNDKHKLILSNGITLTDAALKPEEIYREGFLTKQGQKFKSWKVRFFVLSKCQLAYRGPDGKVIASVPLEGATIKKSEEKASNQYCFEVVTTVRALVLCADTRTEMNEWIRDLKHAVPTKTTVKSTPTLFEDEAILSPITSQDSLYKTECELVERMNVTKGIFQLTNSHVYFFCLKGSGNVKILKWALDQLREIYRRMFLMRNTALEIFLEDRTSILLNFPGEETTKALSKLTSLHPPLLLNFANIPPEKLVARSKLTRKWQERQISNFQYLMALNSFSGRTYNDLNQYPVYPWVLQDYTSPTIDLNNPAVYRDLSKPVGALDEKRLQQYIERYNVFDDPKIPKFHYGTHYSNAGSVLYYLMRLEPFTTYSVQLGGGKFDHPERMFSSIPKAWEGVLSHNNNVKELIPEFFYLPEFLKNQNKIVFGNMVDGVKVDDVVLPPWASSPEEFVKINAAALESEYVSAHLHEWIDLIWGYKQRGDDAVAAYNTFFYLTYPGLFDIDAIEDPVERRSIEAQILNFGQCPTQLFFKAHPKRFTPEELQRKQMSRKASQMLETMSTLFSTVAATIKREDIPLSPLSSPNKTGSISDFGTYLASNRNSYMDEAADSFDHLEKQELHENNSVDLPAHEGEREPSHTPENLRRRSTQPTEMKSIQVLKDSKTPIISILVGKEGHLFLIFNDGAIAVNTFSSGDRGMFNFEVDRNIQTQRQKQIEIIIPFDHGLSQCFALAGKDKFLLSCGNWDNSFKISVVQNTNTIRLWKDFINEHSDIVTCMAIDMDTLVTGSNDGLTKVWDISSLIPSNLRVSTLQLKHKLYGHLGKITCIDLNDDEDLIASGSSDKAITLYSLRKGKYLRKIRFKDAPEIVKISPQGYLVTVCASVNLFVHTFNGKLLQQMDIGYTSDIKITKNGQLLVQANGKAVTIRKLEDLRVLQKFEGLTTTVRCVALSNDDRFAFAGLENGEFIIIPLDFQPRV